jgi:hypothetical protein
MGAVHPACGEGSAVRPETVPEAEQIPLSGYRAQVSCVIVTTSYVGGGHAGGLLLQVPRLYLFGTSHH